MDEPRNKTLHHFRGARVRWFSRRGDLNAAWTAVHKATVQQVVLTGDRIALAAHVAAGT
jgi:hypothetical protein